MIVPVWVRPEGEPSKEILQYAVLDDQSNVSFISQSLCDRLDLEGPSTVLHLTTVQDSNVPVESNRIHGLEVLDYHRENIVKLPTLFSRKNLPADRSQIPKPEVAREWNHLQSIAEKLVPYHPDAEISLLIGSNCPRLIRPREIVAGDEDEPYGQRTLLGWGVIGRVCKSRDEGGKDRKFRQSASMYEMAPTCLNGLLGVLCRFREKKQTLKKTSSIYKLDPFIDQDGLVRVGGRIGNADVPEEVRHPVILPRKCHVTTLLIRSLHQKVNHMGRSTTHNELRQCGYWILGASAAVSNVISQCVTCRRQRRPLEQQKMSSLPKDRVEQVPPFSYSAVDYFGPFVIKERRSELKRYGVLFTCLASRGVHLETANSLDTSSFINALRRFLARRGPVRQIRCDQGTNFVGARNELKAALTEMDEIRVSEYLLEQGCAFDKPSLFGLPLLFV
ncbi:hypothetical protein QZH41_001714 [Actinostola sp. cb2023]|nr:hypothetical protein QZH41_001714 [Actinostola sp. cb2023]